MSSRPIVTRDDRFQLLDALVHNRNRRIREGRFLVQGVRPISMALENGWVLDTVLYPLDTTLSSWAQGVIDRAITTVAIRFDLLAELSEKTDGNVEVLGIFRTPEDDLDRLTVDSSFAGVVLDRPSQPGNIGTTIRSADALGGSGVIISGHAADLYDPKTVRATTGSLFSVPAVRVPAPGAALEWLQKRRAGVDVQIVATDEVGDCTLWEYDFTQPVLLLIGNEKSGLSRSWREHADTTVSIPMSGSASSLNAANAASVVLYEVLRQRTLAR